MGRREAAFGEALARLFVRAGNPTLRAASSGCSRNGVSVSPQRISDWRNGRHLPREFSTVEPLLVWLTTRALRAGELPDSALVIAAAANPTAEAQQAAADKAAAEAQRTAELAEEARLASLAKPSDIARVRGNDQSGAGVTLTVAKEPYAILTDRNKIDLDLLRPYFTDAEIEKALRGWAKATGHRVTMEGAEIGHRNKGVTR